GGPPKLLYTIPSFQNPSGRTLSMERRHALLQLAQRHNFLILEDDPYCRLHFEKRAPASLWSLDQEARYVIGVHTFSKILAPGLRVGWVQAHESVIARMVNAKQALDTCTNVLGQRLVEDFLAQGHLDSHLSTLRELYARRCRIMLESLERRLGDLEG